VGQKNKSSLKNGNNFVAAEYFFLKFHTLIEKDSVHISAKFYKKIFKGTEVIAV